MPNQFTINRSVVIGLGLMIDLQLLTLYLARYLFFAIICKRGDGPLPLPTIWLFQDWIFWLIGGAISIWSIVTFLKGSSSLNVYLGVIISLSCFLHIWGVLGFLFPLAELSKI